MIADAGSTWDTKWMMFAFVSAGVFGGDDEHDGRMTVAWTILQWSLKQCFKGVWPPRLENNSFDGSWRWEMRGKPLCGEFVFAMCHEAADMDCFVQPFGAAALQQRHGAVLLQVQMQSLGATSAHPRSAASNECLLVSGTFWTNTGCSVVAGRSQFAARWL